jgi:hypothetical protein
MVSPRLISNVVAEIFISLNLISGVELGSDVLRCPWFMDVAPSEF